MTNSSRSQGSLLSTILRRSREERLAQTAGGLTFTMLVSMVPLLAVCFAVFAWVPALRAPGAVIREYLLRGLPATLPAWRRPLPFLWESTGVETHFTNGLDPEPRARSVFAFFRPQPSSPKRWWKTCRQR